MIQRLFAILLAVLSMALISCGTDDSQPGNTDLGQSGLAAGQGVTGIAIDTSQTFQTIEGWETYLRMWEEDKINDRFDKSIEDYTDLVANHLANNVGINRARLEVWSGLENPVDYWSEFYNGTRKYSEWKNYRYQKINDNDDPAVANPDGFQFARFDYAVERMLLPLKRAVEARGEKLYVNLCYVDFKWNATTLQGNISHSDNADEYAEFISVFLNRLKNRYGITANALEIILEPENTENWRGTQIGNAILKVTDRIGAEGFTPEIIAPSTTAMSSAVPYLNLMSGVPGAIDRVDTFAYHRYGSESSAMARSIKQAAVQNNLKTAMLEKVGAGVDQLFEDLRVADVSAWTQYGMAAVVNENDASAAYDQGANYVVVRTDGNAGPDKISSASKTAALAQVFRFVRMGATRVSAWTADGDKELLSFVNADGSIAVIVGSRGNGGNLEISGLPAGNYLTEFVAAGSTEVQESGVISHADNGLPLITSMEGAGMLTVYSYR